MDDEVCIDTSKMSKLSGQVIYHLAMKMNNNQTFINAPIKQKFDIFCGTKDDIKKLIVGAKKIASELNRL